MKKVKFLSFLLTLAVVFNITGSIAYAAEPATGATAQMNTPVTNENYTISGAETTDVRFNSLIDKVNQTGQFALVYLDCPDYVYEFAFDLDAVTASTSITDFSDIRSYCFDNESQWREVYLPTSVTEVQFDESQPQPYATDPNVTYFENWLIDKYGNEYSGNLLTTKTQNGVKMYLKSAFQVYVNKDKSYVIRNTMTVAAFVTGVLCYIGGASIISLISLIAGADGLLHMGQSFYEYKLRANWFKYATVVSGTGYPYGLTDKFTYHTGYYYTETGGRVIDPESESTSYVPSSTVYNSNTNIFNNAFDEYNKIGFQEGNF